MIVYGLADYFVGEIIELFPSRAAAEEALKWVLCDEPEGVEIVGVKAIELEPLLN
jgi:hypothetical protein